MSLPGTLISYINPESVYTIISYRIYGHGRGIEQQYDSEVEFKCTDKEYLGDVNGVIRRSKM